MQSSVQDINHLATVFRDDAKEHQDLPPLSKDSNPRCLEFFFDSADVPNFVILDGKIVQAIPPAKTNCLCLVGDDGPIFIQLFGATIFDRRGEWQMPPLDHSTFKEKLDVIANKARSLYSGV